MLAYLSDRQWLWGAAGLYAAGVLLGAVALLRGRRASSAAVYGAILLGYVLQFVGLGLRGHATGGCPLGNRFEIFQFTAWSAITLFLVVGVTFRSSIFGVLTSCLGSALTLVSLAIPSWDAIRRTHIFGGNPWIELHAALAMFSYGVFGLLALTSCMYLLQTYSLKYKHLHGVFSFLPSILELDHISVRLLIAGVVLLAWSLGIGSVHWLQDLSSVDTPKLLTAGLWLAYLVALVLRLSRRLVSQRLAWVCVVLFAVALLSLGPVNASRHPAPAAPAAGLKT